MSLIATQSNRPHPPIRPTLVSQHALSSEDSLGEMPSESSMQFITKLPQHRYHMRVMQSLPIYADPLNQHSTSFTSAGHVNRTGSPKYLYVQNFINYC